MAPEDMAQEEPLQAVVLCDVFNQRFSPLTLDRARVLMPVCQVPLIEWTLESLAAAGVHEVFFLATWHIAQLREYLETHHADLFRPAGAKAPVVGNATSLTRISLLPVPEARSIGDAMRELDAHQVIKSDFVLMHGDALGHLDLASVVAAHRARRRADPNAIMTICTMPAPVRSRTRPIGDAAVWAIAPATSQLLQYTSIPAVPRVPMLRLPLELFDAPKTEVDVRNDLVDCGVDVCAIDVPPLFTENFDYQSLRREFVQGILTSDLLEAKMYVHIAPPAQASSTSAGEPFSPTSGGVLGMPTSGAGYMLRVTDPARYDAASRDVLAGWTFPYTPSLGLPNGRQFSAQPGLRFVGEGVHLASTAVLGRRSMLGAGARLEDHANVHESVLGARTRIGAHSTVHGSYLWDDVSVGTGCTIHGCILGEGVQILDHVHLAHGTVVGDGCVIGPSVRLPPATRVSMHAYRAAEDDSDTDADDADADTALGSASRGYLWAPPCAASSDDSDADDDVVERPANAALFTMGADLASVALSDGASDLSSIDADSDPDMLASELGDSFESDDDESSPSAHGSLSLTLPAGAESQTYSQRLEAEERLAEFRAEAHASLERAFEEKHAPENAAIELKTLRMASNVPNAEVRYVVVSFVLRRCDVDQPKATADLLDHWGPLLREVAQDDQVEALAAMQSFCAAHISHTRLFVPLLKKVYNDEIVPDDAILAWWKHPSSRHVVFEEDTTQARQVVLELRKRAEPVVRHILDDSDDSDDSEESDDSDE